MTFVSPSDDHGNPYASPRVGDPVVDFARQGVGVWRDSELIVMHEDAVLPPFCIKTGLPANGFAHVDAPWLCSSFKFYIAAPGLAVPLAQRWRVWVAWHRQHVGILVFGYFSICLIAGILIGRLLGSSLEVPFAVFGGMISFALLVVLVVVGDPVGCVRSEAGYHWLSGADERFLNQLPEWQPYGQFCR